LPVVTTDAGGIPYIVRHDHTGLMVRCGDYRELAASAIRLLEDQSLVNRLTATARAECEKYSWQAVRNQWVDLYCELACKRDSISRPVESTTSRPVRVLMVAPSLDILGGQAVQASCMLKQMMNEPDMEVSFLPINPRLPGLLRSLQSIKYVRTIMTSPLYLATLLNQVRKHDVIHIFSASYLSFLLAPAPAVLISKLFGKKVVLNYHSGEAEDHLSRWPNTARPVMRLADAIVVPSDYLLNIFARFGFRARAIFNIVDTAMFRFHNRRPLRPVFLSNRNLEALYNVGCILRAFAIIQEQYPEARLTIAGDGSQRGDLEELARVLKLRNTEFVGKISFKEMHGIYDSADIYLNSSNIDNMPGSIIESFASGLPVVTTDAGGIPFIVSDEVTGLMTPRGDYEQMAASAIRLLEDPALVTRLTTAALLECEKYCWNAVRDQWIDVYYELARGESRERGSRRVAA
jgi:L-malate glycosyltransferase